MLARGFLALILNAFATSSRSRRALGADDAGTFGFHEGRSKNRLLCPADLPQTWWRIEKMVSGGSCKGVVRALVRACPIPPL